MDMKNINTFIYTAELGSFTKAAELLGYSQSTVSFQIRQLEEELGTVLFAGDGAAKAGSAWTSADRHVGFAVRGNCRKTVCSFAAEVPGGYDEDRDRRHG